MTATGWVTGGGPGVLVRRAAPGWGADRARRLLTATEREVNRRLHDESDRMRHLTGQWLVREVVARCLGGVDPAGVGLVRRCAACGSAHHGPVHVDGPSADSVRVSLAHSGGIVIAAAIAAGATLRRREQSVGVDVETVTPGVGALATKVLHASELGPHLDLPADERDRDLVVRWVRKEALLKATRTGLTVDPTTIAVSGLGSPARLLAWDPATRPWPFRRADVRLRDLEIPGGRPATIATIVSAGPLGREARGRRTGW